MTRAASAFSRSAAASRRWLSPSLARPSFACSISRRSSRTLFSASSTWSHRIFTWASACSMAWVIVCFVRTACASALAISARALHLCSSAAATCAFPISSSSSWARRARSSNSFSLATLSLCRSSVAFMSSRCTACLSFSWLNRASSFLTAPLIISSFLASSSLRFVSAASFPASSTPLASRDACCWTSFECASWLSFASFACARSCATACCAFSAARWFSSSA
mmetsp:Transcript_30080/g.78765  ORF Transcript_30080/g.78765 Transcript_30080/m.78765 type:complete len:224 (+) Transcript_30080:250-921(+)